ncbi:hypothetical protein [Microbacterium pumilum]|uniref:Uncharacterized protein n=1 Tax=Microbacterium pumilum TaxID=344165 RepID=A0ABP5EG15_9MICO
MRVLVYSRVRLFGECEAAFLDSADFVADVSTVQNVLDLDVTAMEFGADAALIDVTAPPARSAVRQVELLCPVVSTIAIAVVERLHAGPLIRIERQIRSHSYG